MTGVNNATVVATSAECQISLFRVMYHLCGGNAARSRSRRSDQAPPLDPPLPEPAAALNSLSVEELAERAECEIDTPALVIEWELTWVPAWMKPVADELLGEERR